MRSKKYWAERAAALEAEIQSRAAEEQERLNDIYKHAIDNIEQDIETVFSEFTRLTELSEEDARQLITAAQSSEQYEELLALLDEITDADIREEIENKINAQAYGARMNRLQALQERVYNKLTAAGVEIERSNTAFFKDVIQDAYYNTVYDTAKGLDAGIDFSLLPERAISELLKERWHGSNYSERIWKNNAGFISEVQKIIEDGITAGHSVFRMAKKLEAYAVAEDGDSIRYITERLTRSETAHFMSKGQLTAYKEINIQKYRFLAALSERTCSVCSKLDGKVYYVNEAVEGQNYPPIHPNCRCTTIIGDYIPKTRLAYDPETGKSYKVDGSITFEQWRDSLSDEQRQAMELHVKEMKNRSADKKQYEEYKAVLGVENVPKTFDKYQNLKYNDSEQWETLKDYKYSRMKNMISSFTTFEDYKSYKKKINDELIGLITVDGVEIKDQSKHFIERVFGTTEDPKEGRPRSGVEIDDIKNALTKGTAKHREDSLRYFGEKCVVSVNKETGILIQTNPK